MELLGTQLGPELLQTLLASSADRSSQYHSLVDAARARGVPVDRHTLPQLGFIFETLEHNLRAAYEYRPASYPGEVVLLRCSEPMPEPLRRLHDGAGSLYEAADNGWGEFCPALRVLPVHGNHLSMVFEPHVAQVAELLRGILHCN